jgi:hypothetical protein
MWIEENVPITEFFEYAMQSAYKNGHLYVGCLIARQAEFESGFEYIRKNWESFHDLTGEELILVFAGEGFGKNIDGDNLLGFSKPSAFQDNVKRITNPSIAYCGTTSFRGYITIRPQYSETANRYSPSKHTLQIRTLVSYFNLRESDLPVLCVRSTITNTTFVFKLKNIDGTNLYEFLKNFREQLLKKLPTLTETARKSDNALQELKFINHQVNGLGSIIDRQELNRRLLKWREEKFGSERQDLDAFLQKFLSLRRGEKPEGKRGDLLKELRSLSKSPKKYQSGKKIVIKYMELPDIESLFIDSKKSELLNKRNDKLLELEQLGMKLIEEEKALISALSRSQAIKEVLNLAESISANIKIGPIKLDVKSLVKHFVDIFFNRRI